MAYNEIMTERDKWRSLNKCLETLSNKLDEDFKDYPDTPEVQKLIKELSYYKKESFINWMKENHSDEVPTELLYPELEDSDGGYVPAWAFRAH